MITLPVNYIEFFYCFSSKRCKHSLPRGFENIHGSSRVFPMFIFVLRQFFSSSTTRVIFSEEYNDIQEIMIQLQKGGVISGVTDDIQKLLNSFYDMLAHTIKQNNITKHKKNTSYCFSEISLFFSCVIIILVHQDFVLFKFALFLFFFLFFFLSFYIHQAKPQKTKQNKTHA